MVHLPPRRILVPLDGTVESMAGWTQARVLAGLLGSSLEALYVRAFQPVAGDLGLADAAAEQRAHDEAKRWIQARIGPDTPLHYVEGDPAARIVRFAEHGRFDLIVMGTHGRHGLSRALIGSVAEAVARSTKVPVLIAHEVRETFRSVLAPVNLAQYSMGGLEAAAAMAEALGARLALLSVTRPPAAPDPAGAAAIRRMQRLAIDGLPRCCRDATHPVGLMAYGEPVGEILIECEREAHDLVVLVSHIKRPVRDRLLGTTAERILRRARIPVLVVPVSVPAESRRA